MISPHEDAVLNFDLDFLSPNTNNIPVHALKQRYIGQVKKRIIRVDALHNHCKSLKLELCHTNKELDLTKKKLASTSQEYTQTSLEYKEVLENFAKCEKECQDLKQGVKCFQEKYYEAIQNVEAERSYTAQLQQLVKQHEKKIETLQKNDPPKSNKAIKENLEKQILWWKKTHKKDISEWEEKYNNLLKQLNEERNRNSKLNEELLVKNVKSTNEISHSISHDEHSYNGYNISDIISGFGNQHSSQSKVDTSQKCPTSKDEMGMVLDNDFKNETVSVDTGCGSSPTSSLNSPDFVFSPINRESYESNKRKLVNTATSPIRSVKTTHAATSPPPSVKVIDVGTNTVTIKAKTKNSGTQTEPPKSNNTTIKPVNPITTTNSNNNVMDEKVISPVQTLEILPETKVQNDKCDHGPRAVENMPMVEIQETREKNCLELNNSDNIEKDCSTDIEIEMILSTMRLHHKIITPIPQSPKKTVSVDVTKPACQDAALAMDLAKAAKQEAATASKDIAKTNENINKTMITCANLVKDIHYIKNFLQKIALHDAIFKQNDKPSSKDSTICHLINNLSSVDFNKEFSNFSSFVCDKSDLTQPVGTPAHSDSHVAVCHVSEEIAVSNSIENMETNDDGNNVLSNTIKETENCADQNICSEIESIMCLDNSIEEDVKSPNKLKTKSRLVKNKKLTSLGKYRQKCELRKYKIRGKTPPLRKCIKPKHIKQPLKKTATKSDTAATLNDKDVYDKAVKVMAELNAKSSKHSIEPVAQSEHTINVLKKHNDDIQDQNPLLITKSKEHAVVPVKSMTIFSGRTMTSPKSDVTSMTTGTGMTTTVTGITSQDAGITSPITEPISPIPGITSPNSGIKSLMLGITSPNPGITSPKPGITSPNPGITSPNPGITSPSSGITSPNPGITSLMPGITSPNPGIISPNNRITSPIPGITSPNPRITSPTPGITSPIVEIIPKSHNIKSPIPDTTSQAREITSPTIKITSPVPELSSPTPSLTSPKRLDKILMVVCERSDLVSPIKSLSPGSASSTNKLKSPTHSITSPTGTRSTRRSLRFSESSDASHKPRTPLNSDITAPIPSDKNSQPCISIVVPTSPKLVMSPLMSSVTTRSQNKHKPGTTPLESEPTQATSRKRKLSNSSDTQCKRVLRSKQRLDSQENTILKDATVDQEITSVGIATPEDISSWHPRESILCVMIQKYGRTTVRPYRKNVSDAVTKSVNSILETYMLKISNIPCIKDYNTMDELAEELQKYDYKNVVSGLIKYLTNPDRKMELFGKCSSPPAPQMTKYEGVLLYVIKKLRFYYASVDIFEVILSTIEHTLFKLNRTPDFDVVESVSHFYALICRYFSQPSRLKVFMLDAMYCILYKSVPLIKECLEVWPFIIPLAHLSAARTSLVTIFVYLLHFYKCDNDRFKRVQDIRNVLHKRYYYKATEWSEKRILELVRNSIVELKDIPNEQKLLRIALIILGKRHGAKWAQNNIIKNLFQIIDKDKLPEHVTAFCVSLIGPLMKPYPADMKVHCEITMNKLVNIMNTTTSKRVEEAAIISLITMNRHNNQRVCEILLSKKMQTMSPELEETMREYVRTKPLNIWKKHLSKISLSN